MKQKRRRLAAEIIADLKEISIAIKAGTPLSAKCRVSTVRVVPGRSACAAAEMRATRALAGKVPG
jgi:hypothetical protein